MVALEGPQPLAHLFRIGESRQGAAKVRAIVVGDAAGEHGIAPDAAAELTGSLGGIERTFTGDRGTLKWWDDWDSNPGPKP